MNEEKVLIKSRLSSTARTVFLVLIRGFLILGIFCLCIGIIASISDYIDHCKDNKERAYNEYTREYEYVIRSFGDYNKYCYETYEELLDAHPDYKPKYHLDYLFSHRWGKKTIGSLGWTITALSSLFICLIAYIMYRCYLKCSLSVTEKNVIGRTLFGKKVNLPIYQISSYSTRTLFSQIIVSTSSGNTAFHFIENYEEIGTLLRNLINERQKDTALNTTVTTESHKPSSLDEIKTLKELLDNGIITQEEFDAKKKQLLGL